MNKRFLLPFLGLCLAAGAHAQMEVQPIIYNRVIMTLIPKAEAKIISTPGALPAPKAVAKTNEEDKEALPNKQLATKADAKAKDELKVEKTEPAQAMEVPIAPPPREPIAFTVEIKSPDFLDQPDFINQSSFGEHEGLFISIDPPQKASLTATNMVSRADVIFINEDGVITKMAPNLNLTELAEPISSGSPVRGFLYLNPGSVERDRLAPGDRFENGIFKTHPVILQ